MGLERLCLFCEEFCFSMGEPGYSAWTSGDDARIYCEANHWEMNSGDNELLYRMNLLRGLTCPDFLLARMLWLDSETRKLLES